MTMAAAAVAKIRNMEIAHRRLNIRGFLKMTLILQIGEWDSLLSSSPPQSSRVFVPRTIR